MEDLYVECLVAKEPKPTEALIKGAAYGVTVLCFLLGVINVLFLIPFVILVVVDIFLLPRLSVEYEYLYVSRSLQVDAIYSKQRRKKAVEYDLEKMDIFAEEGAWQLDEYKNLKTKDRDYTSGRQDAIRWVLIVHDGQNVDRVLLEPNTDLINAIKGIYPRKTFTKS